MSISSHRYFYTTPTPIVYIYKNSIIFLRLLKGVSGALCWFSIYPPGICQQSSDNVSLLPSPASERQPIIALNVSLMQKYGPKRLYLAVLWRRQAARNGYRPTKSQLAGANQQPPQKAPEAGQEPGQLAAANRCLWLLLYLPINLLGNSII